jgi:hypothetical protein
MRRIAATTRTSGADEKQERSSEVRISAPEAVAKKLRKNCGNHGKGGVFNGQIELRK